MLNSLATTTIELFILTQLVETINTLADRIYDLVEIVSHQIRTKLVCSNITAREWRSSRE